MTEQGRRLPFSIRRPPAAHTAFLNAPFNEDALPMDAGIFAGPKHTRPSDHRSSAAPTSTLSFLRRSSAQTPASREDQA
jgi:hypothetical protein